MAIQLSDSITQEAIKVIKEFDAYEIQFVSEDEYGNCEPVDDIDPEAKLHFWTLYGHIPDEGVDAIYDAKTRDDAVIMYKRITGSSKPLSIEGPEIDPLNLN